MKNFLIVLMMLFSSPSVWSQGAQPTLPQKWISINGHKLHVEIADSPEELQKGLMFRERLEEGQGMLFIFPDEDLRAFWMKNTFIPLSIAYISSKKVIVDIQDMAPAKSMMQSDFPSYPSSKPAQYALEVPQNWFKKNGIKVGAQIKGL
ncbi:MAG: DUF192 domain-containing protein [Proteobacteria bacterium]|jgi:hypothetical protein|nr:DUF192 domain-containing protein [Pseudomonadota bacterium]